MSDEYPPPSPSFTATPPPARNKHRNGCAFWVPLILAVVFFGTTVLLLLALAAVVSGKASFEAGGQGEAFVEEVIAGRGENKILLIPIEGLIADVPRSGFLRSGPGIVQSVKSMLKTAEADDAVKGLILSIDSPGGGITDSDILYHELKSFRERTGKPIISILGDVAASGGYYVAAASQHIVAHPTTVTGSIGVIMPLVGIEDLMAKIGVKVRPVKSGEMKDVGAFYRDMTPNERAMLQDIVNQYYQRFLDIVESGFKDRGVKIAREELEKYCDGRIFTGQTAKELHFVDQVGYLEDAYKAAQDKLGLGADSVRLIAYKRKQGLLDMVLARGSAPNANALTINLDALTGAQNQRFQYLWQVGRTATDEK